VAGIARAHRLEVLGAALLGHLQARRSAGGSMARPSGTTSDSTRAPWLPPVTSTRSRPSSVKAGTAVAQGQHFGAHRIADQVDLARVLGLQPVDLGIGGRDGIDPARSRRLTRPSTAFCSWITLGILPPSPPAARQRRIAAEADHREGARKLSNRRSAMLRPSRPPRTPLASAAGSCRSARRAGHGREEIGLAGDRRAALVGDQRDVVPAPLQLAASAKAGIRCPPVPPAAST
jgi:hypothetical protein